jgi:hypothetical protein
MIVHTSFINIVHYSTIKIELVHWLDHFIAEENITVQSTKLSSCPMTEARETKKLQQNKSNILPSTVLYEIHSYYSTI